MGKILPSLFFADLRTVQQLGHVVQAQLLSHFGIRELVFLVQGTAQPPANVSKSILTFVDSMPELADKLSAAELSTYVASTRTGLLQKPISIEDAQKGLGTSLFTQISESCTRTFDDNLALAAALDDITLAVCRMYSWTTRHHARRCACARRGHRRPAQAKVHTIRPAPCTRVQV